MNDLRSASEAAHLVEHFLVFGKASLFVFGEDQFAVDEDIELAWLANGQFRWCVKGILNFGRETHGARFVVSNVAINDFDLHSEPPNTHDGVLLGRVQVGTGKSCCFDVMRTAA